MVRELTSSLALWNGNLLSGKENNEAIDSDGGDKHLSQDGEDELLDSKEDDAILGLGD